MKPSKRSVPSRSTRNNGVQASDMPDQFANHLVEHWNRTYERAETAKLGWYEESPQPSLDMIESCRLTPDSHILHVGAGASTLVDEMLDAGYTHMTATDISAVALERIRQRLGSQSRKVNWLVDDLTSPHLLEKLPPVDLWHDRAVLHFFVDECDRKAYFDLLRQMVKPDGFVILAAFNPEGAERCSGLPVRRYDAEMMSEELGAAFELLEAFDYIYTMPSGDTRPYVYTRFRRKK